jgi:branched-chain amino acid aminotransferase
MAEYIYINGKFFSSNKASIPVTDAGLLYGDGLFETLRSYKGSIFVFDKHLERLFVSLKSLKYNPHFDTSFIKSQTLKLLEVNNLLKKDAYIKIVVTRSAYIEKFRFDFWGKPNLIIMAKNFSPYPENYYENGITIISSSIMRNAIGNELYKYKLLNYFENIFAKNEAYVNGAQEAIFLTRDKVVLEGAISNIFCVKSSKVFTPPITQNILPGITREIVIEICKQNNLKFSEKRLHYFNLLEADEIFMTNSIMEIIPVRQVDTYKISNDQIPGSVTKKLMNLYRRIVNESASSIK